MARVILFLGPAANWGFLSNFAAYPIRLQGKVWPTVEHYFQAQKFLDTSLQKRIRNARTPGAAKRMGCNRRNRLRPDWETIKVRVMREALLAKFAQHQVLLDELLATGDAVLVEHTASDAFWGDGGDGSGHNRLGKLLMEIRDQLHNEHDAATS